MYTIHVSLSVSCDDVTTVDDKWIDGMGRKEDDIIMKRVVSQIISVKLIAHQTRALNFE